MKIGQILILIIYKYGHLFQITLFQAFNISKNLSDRKRHPRLSCHHPLGMYLIFNLDCGVLKTFVDLYKDSTNGVQGSYTQMKTLLNSVIAFCVITGIVQLLTSILIILINLSCLGNTKRNIWTRVISTTVILSLASNFAVAAITGMLYTYFK